MAVVLGLTGLVVHGIFGKDLDGTIDRSLRSRSQDVAALVRAGRGASLARGGGEDEDFAQVLTPGGRLLAATPQVRARALLRGTDLRRAGRSAVVVEHPPVAGLDGSLRLRAWPVEAPRGRAIAVVGTSLGERDDSLKTLALLLAAGGGVALLLACLAGYGVASGALRPVEAMRRRAAAISPAGSGQRLPVPRSGDELARLGTTLNEMLDRLETAFARERAFTADASHELRTPLGILKAELELALRRGRSPAELRAALESAAEETERLVQLAEDLLVMARLDQGRLPVRLEELDAQEVVAAVAERFEARGRAGGRPVRAEPGEPLRVRADRARLEQALGNVVDNAFRHGAGPVRVSARAGGGFVELHVADAGGGFPPGFRERAFERFARADGARSRGGAGLGLAIVAAIAASHGGSARAADAVDGGADVCISLPVDGVSPS